MYFYVDESGNTGFDLFNEDQPILYYGILSSFKDLDILSGDFAILKAKIGVEELHASKISISKLDQIAHDLIYFKEMCYLKFDLLKIDKQDHAIICFFDNVFDNGNNRAVPYNAYWTEKRYLLLLEVATLFDEKNSRKAWEALITLDKNKSCMILVDLCNELLNQASQFKSTDFKTIICDALNFTINNPTAINYNVNDKEMRQQLSPNLINFQSVLSVIGLRCKSINVEATKILVDQQFEFNAAQEFLSKFYAENNNVFIETIPGIENVDWTHFPKISIECISSNNNVGLQLVDTFLWVRKRFLENKEKLSSKLKQLAIQLNDGFNEISLEGIKRRIDENGYTDS